MGKTWIFEDVQDPKHPLAMFLCQVILTLVLTRVLGKLFGYMKQPMVIGEILGGVVLGPSCLGQIDGYYEQVWPDWSKNTFNVCANLGLIFFMFLLGLEVDHEMLGRLYKSALPIATSAILFPFGIGVANSFWLNSYNLESDPPPEKDNQTAFILFIGTSLSFTAFPVLASILYATKLIKKPIGLQTLAIASIDDVFAWCLLAIATSFSATGEVLEGIYVFIISIVYVVVMIFITRPVLQFVHTLFLSRDKEESHYFIVVIFIVILASSLTTEVIGIHAFFGAFIAGLVMPKSKGTITKKLEPKLELLTKYLLLPLYFAFSGIKTDLTTLTDAKDWGIILAISLLAIFAKVTPTVLSAKLVTKRDWKYCFAMGVLMNTRGLVVLIALNVGLDNGILSIKLFSVLVVMALVTTVLTGPIIHYMYKTEDDPANENKENRMEFEEIRAVVTEEALQQAREVDDLSVSMSSQLHQG